MLVYKVKVALQYYFTSPPVYLPRYIYIYIYITPRSGRSSKLVRIFVDNGGHK